MAWRRVLTEGAVIVFSILLAFWIDAWWDDSQQREREIVLLQALLDDLEVMRQRVDSQRTYNEAILAATTELLEIGAGDELDLGPEEMDKLLGNVVWYNASTRWESAAMDLLVSGGDLADLSDLELVRLLAPLHNRLKSTQRRYRLDETHYRDQLIPFLTQQANLPQILSTIDHAPGMPQWTYDFPAIEFSGRVDHSYLLANNEFLGILAAKIDLQHDILRYSLENMDDHLDEVIVVLRANLDE